MPDLEGGSRFEAGSRHITGNRDEPGDFQGNQALSTSLALITITPPTIEHREARCTRICYTMVHAPIPERSDAVV